MGEYRVYVGNYQYGSDEKELELLITKYGQVKDISFKSGYCFVDFEDKASAEECIAAMDGMEYGSARRRLRVEYTKSPAPEKQSRRGSNAQPNNTIFVAGFDHLSIRSRDLETEFERFGRIKRCDMRKTFAFIEFETLDDAKRALNEMHGKTFRDKELTVEYVLPSSTRGRGRDRPGTGDRPRRGGRYDDRRGREYYSSDRDFYYADRGRRSSPEGERRRERGGGGRYRSRSRSYDGYRRSGGRGENRDYSPGYGRGGRRGRSESPMRRRGRGSPSPRRYSKEEGRMRSRSPMIGRRGRRSMSRSRSPPPPRQYR